MYDKPTIIKCPYCGNDVHSGDVICSVCGNEISAAHSTVNYPTGAVSTAPAASSGSLQFKEFIRKKSVVTVAAVILIILLINGIATASFMSNFCGTWKNSSKSLYIDSNTIDYDYWEYDITELHYVAVCPGVIIVSEYYVGDEGWVAVGDLEVDSFFTVKIEDDVMTVTPSISGVDEYDIWFKK